jgi:N-acetylglucosamine-6-sulfatase
MTRISETGKIERPINGAKYLLIALFCMAFPELSHASPPNIVVIMTDDQTLETVAQMGQTTSSGLFGNITKAGTTFLNSYVVVPQCGPSRASFLTGQYPHNHGLYTNNTSPNGYASFSEASTLATWLQNSGYRTGLVGKYINGYGAVLPAGGRGSPSLWVPPGWSDWEAFVSPAYYNYQINVNGALETHGSSAGDYSTDVLAAKAANFITASGTGPFFLWVTLNAPHDPFTPPPRYATAFAGVAGPRNVGWNEADMSDKPTWLRALPLLGPAGSNVIPWIDAVHERQMGTLLAVDDAVSTILSALSSSGALPSTYVIFTSDNGFMKGQHRLPYNKTVAYDPSAKVPLIIRGPGVLAERTRSEIVSNIDLTATILDLAGVMPRRVIDGTSFRQMLSSPTAIPIHNYLLLEFMVEFPQSYPVSTGPSYTIPAFGAVVSDAYKYIRSSTSEIELYDRTADPGETNSLHADPAMAGTVTSYDAMLQLMKACVGLQCAMTAPPSFQLRFQ